MLSGKNYADAELEDYKANMFSNFAEWALYRNFCTRYHENEKLSESRASVAWTKH